MARKIAPVLIYFRTGVFAFITATTGCTGTDDVVRCELGNLAADECGEVTISVKVDAAASDPLTNRAELSSDTTDPNLDNNHATVTTAVSPALVLLGVN